MKKSDISNKSQTDWERLDAMKDNERLTEVFRECETDLEVKERAMPSLRDASLREAPPTRTAGFAYAW